MKVLMTIQWIDERGVNFLNGWITVNDSQKLNELTVKRTLEELCKSRNVNPDKAAIMFCCKLED